MNFEHLNKEALELIEKQAKQISDLENLVRGLQLAKEKDEKMIALQSESFNKLEKSFQEVLEALKQSEAKLKRIREIAA